MQQAPALPYTGVDCARCGHNAASVRVFGPALVDDDALGKVWTLQLARQYGLRAYCTDCLAHRCAVCGRYGLAKPHNEYYRFQVAPELDGGAEVCNDCALPCVQCHVLMNGHPDAADGARMHVGCRAAWDEERRLAEYMARRARVRARQSE